MLFPIVWGLGPNMSGVWSYELTLTFFAFGDLFSKNIFTFIGYKYTMSVLEKEDQEAMKNGKNKNIFIKLKFSFNNSTCSTVVYVCIPFLFKP